MDGQIDGTSVTSDGSPPIRQVVFISKKLHENILFGKNFYFDSLNFRLPRRFFFLYWSYESGLSVVHTLALPISELFAKRSAHSGENKERKCLFLRRRACGRTRNHKPSSATGKTAPF